MSTKGMNLKFNAFSANHPDISTVLVYMSWLCEDTFKNSKQSRHRSGRRKKMHLFKTAL